MAGEQGLYNPVTEPYIRNLLQRAQAASQQPYQPYTGIRVAQPTYDMDTASAGLRGMTADPLANRQAAGYYNQAATGLGSLTNFNSGRIASTYDPRMVDMFAHPGAASMYTKPGDTSMFARPQDAQMFARPQDSYMFARPDNITSDFQAGEFDQAAAQKYMSPYTQSVTDIAKREAERMFAAQAAQRDLQAAGRGSFGGSRNEIAQTEARRNNNQLLTDMDVKGLSEAYMNAQAQYERDRQGRGLEEQFQMDAAKTNAANALAYGGLGLQNQQFNSNMGLQYGMAGLQNQQFNAGLAMDYGKTGLQNQQFNTNNAYQYGRDNLQNQQFNIGTNMQYGTAGLQNSQFNEMSRYNAGDMRLRGDIANEAARAQAAGVRLGAYGGIMNAANGLQQVGQNTFNNNLQRYNALANIGQLQQNTNQRALDTQYQNFLDQQNWNKNNVNYMAGILNSQPINPSYSYSSGPQQNSGGNTISNIAGLALAGYGAYQALK